MQNRRGGGRRADDGRSKRLMVIVRSRGDGNLSSRERGKGAGMGAAAPGSRVPGGVPRTAGLQVNEGPSGKR